MIDLLIQDPAKVINHVENPAPVQAVDAFGQLPEMASTFTDVDGLFYFTYAVCIFFFVLITGVLLYSVVAHRRKTWDQPALSNVTHNTPLEVVWTVIPLIIVMVMFAWGFKGSLDMMTAPHAAARNTYKATAKQWNWTFTYPNSPVKSFNEVWVEVDKPVQFLLESTDVLHAFYVPAMRVKRDVVPGRYNAVWFHPTKTGDYHLFCAEYCGKDHSRMYAQVHVVDAATFAKEPWNTWDDSTPEAAAKSGGNVAKALCASCHSFDGTPGVGPSWKGLFVKGADGTLTGRQREVIEDGQARTIAADEAYIIESIRNPSKKIVAESPYNKGGMTQFGPEVLDDTRIKGIIEFMKSLAD